MKPNTNAKLPTIAKMLAKENPEVFRQMCEKSEPMLKNVSLVPLLYGKIKEEYPEQDKFEESIMFVSCVYHAYSPATMLGDNLERAPNGIRKAMCEIMQWNDAPTVNYYQKRSQAYFKGMKYREKVNHILSFFQGNSVKSNQPSLF